MTYKDQIEIKLDIALSKLDDLLSILLDETNVSVVREARRKELQRISRLIDLSISKKHPVPAELFDLKHHLLLKNVDSYIYDLQYNTYYKLLELIVQFKGSLDDRVFSKSYVYDTSHLTLTDITTIQDIVIEVLRGIGSAYYIEIRDMVWERNMLYWVPDDLYFIERYSCYAWEYLIMRSLDKLKNDGKVIENEMRDIWTLKECYYEV